jgi:hypothetical protein
VICRECAQLLTLDDDWLAHSTESGGTAYYHVGCFDEHRRRRRHDLFVFFLAKERLTMKLILGDTVGLILVLAETKAGAPFALGSGPFLVKVDDPGGTVTVTDGTPDQKTPTAFHLNGSGKTGTVTVTVTDSEFNLVGTGSFDVEAAAAPPPPPPPPPPAPDALSVSFAVPAAPVQATTAAPAAPSSTPAQPASSGTASAAPAGAAPATAAPGAPAAAVGTSAPASIAPPASGRSDQPG